jgi:hypothetical protein
MGVCGLQQWAREAEAALDHEMHTMHRSVSEAVSSDTAALLSPFPDVPGYMASMSLAASKLASLESFVRQVSCPMRSKPTRALFTTLFISFCIHKQLSMLHPSPDEWRGCRQTR